MKTICNACVLSLLLCVSLSGCVQPPEFPLESSFESSCGLPEDNSNTHSLEEGQDSSPESSLEAESSVSDPAPKEEPPPAFPESVTIRVLDSNGVPAINATLYVNGEDGLTVWMATNSRGEITFPTTKDNYFSWDHTLLEVKVDMLNAERVEAFTLDVAPPNGPVFELRLANPSTYEAIKSAENRVEITLLDPRGEPLQDFLVSVSRKDRPAKEPDAAGGNWELRYTDGEGMVYYNDLAPGDHILGTYDGPEERRYRKAMEFTVLELDGVQSFSYQVEEP